MITNISDYELKLSKAVGKYAKTYNTIDYFRKIFTEASDSKLLDKLRIQNEITDSEYFIYNLFLSGFSISDISRSLNISAHKVKLVKNKTNAKIIYIRAINYEKYWIELIKKNYDLIFNFPVFCGVNSSLNELDIIKCILFNTTAKKIYLSPMDFTSEVKFAIHKRFEFEKIQLLVFYYNCNNKMEKKYILDPFNLDVISVL